MFVVLIDYTAEIGEIDAQLPAHREWIAAAIAGGRLMVAGGRVPRTGGALFVRGTGLAEVEAWAASDPFALAGVASYQVIELEPTLVAPGFEAFRE